MLRIGHRGDPRHAPENTLVSLETAWRHGRRVLEFDVRASRDEVPVVFHDRLLERTTDGVGPVANYRWQALAHLDAGGWFHRRFAGEPVASVRQVLAAFRHRPLRLFLDVKVPGIERELHGLIEEMGMSGRCWIASYHLDALKIFKRLAPWWPLYRVTGFGQPITARRIQHARTFGLTGFVAYKRWVTSELVRRLRAEALELYVWTVRRRDEEERFRRMGVTGVMTERCVR